MHHSTNCNCAYAHTTDCLHLYVPQHKLSVIVPMHIPQTVYISMHHSTNCLYLYLCRPRHRLSRSVCTTADIAYYTTDCQYLCTPYHRLSIPLYTIPQTVYTSVHHYNRLPTPLYTVPQTVYTSAHHTTDCLYRYAPYNRLSIPLYTDCLYLCTQTVYTSVHRLSINTSISTPCNRLSIIYLPICDKERGEQGDKRVKRPGGGGGGAGGHGTGRGVLVAAGRRMGEVYEWKQRRISTFR